MRVNVYVALFINVIVIKIIVRAARKAEGEGKKKVLLIVDGKG